MSVHKDSRAVNKLFITLRDQVKPEKSTREDKKNYDKIEKIEFRKIQGDSVCDAVTGISIEKFGEYLDELQETHKLPGNARKAFEDALISDGKRGGFDEFNLSESGEIRLLLLECVVSKKDTKIDLAFAVCNMSFKNDEEEQTDGERKPFTMSLKEKNAFIKLYRKRLYKSVDQKCKRKA